MKNKKYIKICPKCGATMPLRTDFVEILAPTMEKCKCGYAGLFPEIDINEIENFRKKIKEMSKTTSHRLVA